MMPSVPDVVRKNMARSGSGTAHGKENTGKDGGRVNTHVLGSGMNPLHNVCQFENGEKGIKCAYRDIGYTSCEGPAVSKREFGLCLIHFTFIRVDPTQLIA